MIPSSFDLSRSTRRTATVTTSAPDASIASIICALDAYLPVPTIRRERNSRPAMAKGCGSLRVIEEIRSACATGSASAHEGDDLDGIVGCKLQLREGCPVAQNYSVALDDDCPRVEREGGKKIRQRPTGGNPPLGAIDDQSEFVGSGRYYQGACLLTRKIENALQTAKLHHTCER